jgi:transcriptional regulator with XRE-family HTH domain
LPGVERRPSARVRRGNAPGGGTGGAERLGNARETGDGIALDRREPPMPAPSELDPAESPLAFFGSELRHYRTKAGLTLEQLGEKINYSISQIGAIETGKRPPRREFAKLCDEALTTDGALTRLWRLARKSPFPGWFHRWMDIEESAHLLRSWEPLLIPGLLQTADYARAIISQRPDRTPEQVEETVAARLARQEILERAKPPLLCVVLDEGVLNRPVGDKKVMREQLLALIDAARSPRISIQVVPVNSQPLLGLTGAFVIASVPGETDVVYVEGVGKGYVTDQQDDVATLVGWYEAIRSLALPAPASLDFIYNVVEDKWT